jgi:Outer membrane protein beta-barrel domain
MEMQNENEQKLDNKVQELLKDLTVPYNPDHWQNMAQRLNNLDAAETDFDAKIRQRLENTTPSFQATHWDLMNEKLDDLNDADADFDATIREQLNNIHRTYQPKHWDLMSQRIEQEFSWKAKIMRYKVAEVALMLLLLFTVYNYFENVGYDKEGDFRAIEPKTIQKKGEPKSFNKGTDWRNRDNNNNKTKQQDNFKPQAQDAQKPIVSVENLENTIRKGFVLSNGSSENQVQSTDNQPIVSIENKGVENPAIGGIENGSAEKAAKPSTPTLNSSTQTTQNDAAAIAQIPILKADEIASTIKDLDAVLGKNAENTEGGASAQSIAVLRPNALTIAQMYDAPIIPQLAKKDKWWRLGVFSNSGVSNVSSSYLYKDDTKKWNFWSLSKGIGLVVGIRKKKVELETGLAYNTLKYEPNLPSEILEGRLFNGPAFSTQLTKEVDLALINMPVNMKIHLEDNKRWHFYTMAGVSFNAAVKMETVNFEPSSSSVVSTNRSSSKDRDFPVYGEPYKISLDKNVNNFYYTANLGMGVEYKITPVHSVYIQPQYERHFGNHAIGSRSDRINSMTVQGGVKMRFKSFK